MHYFSLNPVSWRAMDDDDRAFCIAHFRLHGAYEAQSSHVAREIAEIMAKEKKDGSSGKKKIITSPFDGWGGGK